MTSSMSRDSSVQSSSFFSSVHASNIQIDDSSNQASRHVGTYNGLAFSNQPLQTSERINVVIELNQDYDGDLRLGVTKNDPATINQLPKYSCPMLCGKVGYWLAAIPGSSVENNSRYVTYNFLKLHPRTRHWLRHDYMPVYKKKCAGLKPVQFMNHHQSL